MIQKGDESQKTEVTIDDAYLLRALKDPLAEHPEGYPPAMPNLNLSVPEQIAMIKWLKTL